MKLNKKGWGLVTELVVILIAIILLVYSVYGLNQLGLIRNMNDALGPGIKPDLVISGKTISYESVEGTLISASQEYVVDKYNNDFVGDQLVIRVSHLIKNGYISTIRDVKNKECSGYVIATKNTTSISYTPYLKCKNYETAGYSEEYDW